MDEGDETVLERLGLAEFAQRHDLILVVLSVASTILEETS